METKSIIVMVGGGLSKFIKQFASNIIPKFRARSTLGGDNLKPATILYVLCVYYDTRVIHPNIRNWIWHGHVRCTTVFVPVYIFPDFFTQLDQPHCGLLIISRPGTQFGWRTVFELLTPHHNHCLYITFFCTVILYINN